MNKKVSCDNYGKFIKELNNRFMASVEIDGDLVTCYVKSSSKLCNYLELKNKKVLLKENKNSKFKYFIYAVKYKRSAILLCPSLSNNIVFDSLNKRIFSFLEKRKNCALEFNICGYKSDLYIPESKTFIEIKSIISYEDEVFFPTVYSERFVNQLNAFDSLLKIYKGYLFLVCLNPYCKSIKLKSNSKDVDLLRKQIKNGLIIKGFVIDFINGYPTIKKEIPIII